MSLRLVIDCARLDAGRVDRIEVHASLALDEPPVMGATVADGVVEVAAVVSAATGGAFVVRGRISGAWTAECRRCLDEVSGPLDVALQEVFEWTPTEGETWLIDDQRIDLAPAARQAVILDLPLAPLCSPDCAGPVPDRFPTGPSARSTGAPEEAAAGEAARGAGVAAAGEAAQGAGVAGGGVWQ